MRFPAVWAGHSELNAVLDKHFHSGQGLLSPGVVLYGLAPAVVRINKPQQTPENKTCSIDFTGREFVESAISGFFPEFIDGGGQFYGTIGIVECDG